MYSPGATPLSPTSLLMRFARYRRWQQQGERKHASQDGADQNTTALPTLRASREAEGAHENTVAALRRPQSMAQSEKGGYERAPTTTASSVAS